MHGCLPAVGQHIEWGSVEPWTDRWPLPARGLTREAFSTGTGSLTDWKAQEKKIHGLQTPTCSFTPNHYIHSRVINNNHMGCFIQDSPVGYVVYCVGVFVLLLPVQGVAHLYGNQDRQGHSHGIRRLKDWTLHTSKLNVAFTTLQVVWL